MSKGKEQPDPKAQRHHPMIIQEKKEGAEFKQTPTATVSAGQASNEVKNAWNGKKMEDRKPRKDWKEGFARGEGVEREKSELHKVGNLRLDLQSYNKERQEAHYALQEGKKVYGQVHLEEKIPEHVRYKVNEKTGETIRSPKVDQALHAAMAKSLNTGKIFEVKYNPNKDKHKAQVDNTKKKQEKQDENDRRDREETRRGIQEYNDTIGKPTKRRN